MLSHECIPVGTMELHANMLVYTYSSVFYKAWNILPHLSSYLVYFFLVRSYFCLLSSPSHFLIYFHDNCRSFSCRADQRLCAEDFGGQRGWSEPAQRAPAGRWWGGGLNPPSIPPPPPSSMSSPPSTTDPPSFCTPPPLSRCTHMSKSKEMKRWRCWGKEEEEEEEEKGVV